MWHTQVHSRHSKIITFMTANYKFCHFLYVAANVSCILTVPSNVSKVGSSLCSSLYGSQKGVHWFPHAHGIFSWLLLGLGSFSYWNKSVPEFHGTLSSQFTFCWIRFWTSTQFFNWHKNHPLTGHLLDGQGCRRWVTGTVCITQAPFHIECWASPLGHRSPCAFTTHQRLLS